MIQLENFRTTFNDQITIEIEIEQSIYETNSFLLDKEPNLIQYAAFFGLIQIYSYLNLKWIELTPSLRPYSIRGRNKEIIQTLEDNGIESDDYSVESVHSYSFRFCQSFEKVSFPNSVKFVGESTFSECKFLLKRGIPSITIIEESHFTVFQLLLLFQRLVDTLLIDVLN